MTQPGPPEHGWALDHEGQRVEEGSQDEQGRHDLFVCHEEQTPSREPQCFRLNPAEKERITKRSAKLGGLMGGVITSLSPDPSQGITHESLSYVVRCLKAEKPLRPPNVELGTLETFLKFVSEVCNTIWKYQCDRTWFKQLRQEMNTHYHQRRFSDVEDAASYLTITAFVLGEELDTVLPEQVTALVWSSNSELACVSLLQEMIQSIYARLIL
jgi:hypothetical protein